MMKNKIERIYYVYYLRRIDKRDLLDSNLLQPFYVGKGKGNQVFSHRKYALRTFNKPGNRRLVYKMIHKFMREELDFIEEIMFDNLTEAEAHEIEMSSIALYGRINNGTGCLANLTDGGEGVSGWVPSDETRQKMSISHTGIIGSNLGIPMPEEVKQKISKTLTGIKHSKETIQRQKDSAIRGPAHHMKGKYPSEKSIEALKTYHKERTGKPGKPHTKEAKQKMRGPRPSLAGENNPMHGKHHKEEARKKMSATRKKKHETIPLPWEGKPMPEEQKLHISIALKGRVFSEEHKAKIREGVKLYWMNKKKAVSDEN